MKALILIPLASLFLSSRVFAGDAAPKRGVSTCALGRDCSWPAGRALPQQNTAVKSAPVPPIDRIKTSAAKAIPTLRLEDELDGNLPSYYGTGDRRSPLEATAVIIQPEKITGALLAGLRAGDILPAELEQSIKASPSVPTPIRARIVAGRFRGAYLLGTATLDRELKRVLLAFARLRVPSSDISFQLRATGLAPSGQVGIEGEHHTQEGTYFAAELGAAAAAGYADATTSRSQSLLGGFQTEPTAANAAKQGAVQALSKTADRLAERARTAPEYTEVEAGRAIQIIIQEAASEISGT